MTANDAYSKLKRRYPDLMIVKFCKDFGSFFLFGLAPLDAPEGETYRTGRLFDAVDKKTGRIYKYDITSDIDAYYDSIDVEVNTIFDERMVVT